MFIEEYGNMAGFNGIIDLMNTEQFKSSPQMMEGAELILKVLENQGVEIIFGYPGGAVLPIYDALFRNNSIRHILVRHEQAAVHAAEGYARSTGRLGLCLSHLDLAQQMLLQG